MRSTSKAPKKQRRLLKTMPLHWKRERLSSHLSKELRKKLKKRALGLRSNDVVKIMIGAFKGKTGKVIKLNYSAGKVFVEKISRKKADGTEVMVPLKASNLMIIELDRSDARRLGAKKAKEKEAKEKPKKKVEERKEKRAEEKPKEEKARVKEAKTEAGLETKAKPLPVETPLEKVSVEGEK